ncbi:MAG: YebC/PmpR family DNA-binding transcriptional regulator [Candidatus Bipolaricaulota bacterium]|nr:MAG: YebC/PmpR family DNA-binding transcriptional regulator [Candidatus Bipolaricaulota bacterium]
MAGHSKWANTKYRKERQDKKRSGIFAKLIREITLHARSGDPDPANNAALAQAIERAKAANLPKDNIEKAIKRATGDLDGATLEEAMYEGYAQDGVAVLIRVVTDNRNRAAAGIRHIFSKHGGSMAAAGSVAWQFDRRGTVVIDELPEGVDRDELLMTLIESGAEDLNEDDDVIEAYCDPSDLRSLAETVRDLGISPSRSEVTMVPKSTVHVEGQTAQKLLRLLDALDDNEDVQQVFANFDVPDEVLAGTA